MLQNVLYGYLTGNKKLTSLYLQYKIDMPEQYKVWVHAG